MDRGLCKDLKDSLRTSYKSLALVLALRVVFGAGLGLEVCVPDPASGLNGRVLNLSLKSVSGLDNKTLLH